MYYLCHHGVIGQKWGVRRYQNKDGTLTRAGKKQMKKTAKSRSLAKANQRYATKQLTKESERLDSKLSKIDRKLAKTDADSGAYKRYSSKQSKLTERSVNVNTKLSGIKDGSIKAGRDYVVASKPYKIPYAYVGLTGPRIGSVNLAKKYLVFT